jgi:hypothetical protein
MSALAFAGEMAGLQQAIAESHDLAVRRGVVLAALNLRTGGRVLEVGCGVMEPRPPTPIGRTRPGVYIPTAITIGWSISHVTPFALTSPAQFRPKAPPSLKGAEWASDYNQIKELGEKNSTKRSARQTEDARFWISVNPGMLHLDRGFREDHG